MTREPEIDEARPPTDGGVTTEDELDEFRALEPVTGRNPEPYLAGQLFLSVGSGKTMIGMLLAHELSKKGGVKVVLQGHATEVDRLS